MLELEITRSRPYEAGRELDCPPHSDGRCSLRLSDYYLGRYLGNETECRVVFPESSGGLRTMRTMQAGGEYENRGQMYGCHYELGNRS